MIQFKRYLSVLFCCVLLSIGFSSIVKADETKLENYQVEINNLFYYYTATISAKTENGSSITIHPYNGTQEKTFTNHSLVLGQAYYGKFQQTWKFSHTGGAKLFPKDKETSVEINNGYYNVGVTRLDGGTDHSSVYLTPYEVKCLVYYFDNTTEYIDVDYSISQRNVNLSFEITPSIDVVSFEIILISRYNVQPYNWKYFDNVGEFISDSSFTVTLDTQSDEAGLLGGIIEWVKNIFNKIGEISETISNLPSMIWNFISDGLKGLFVPSDEYLNQYKESMIDLLNNKFGAVFECVIIFQDLWERIQANDETNTIDFPEVTIPLPDNNEFTFGGQQVKIVPDGFDWLVNSLKMLVGIVCTILFVNGLKKRYEEIMGGH